jgi:POT family proton-dependent oligopeptide transporter
MSAAIPGYCQWMSTETKTRDERQADHRFFGHPWPLATLFGVEMWERFSFYGMQGILLIYLYYKAADGGLGINQSTATGIVGAYGGLVYLSTIVGGWLADRVLGSERTLFASAVLIMVGHVALSVLPGVLGVGVGLVAVALGSGGLKANATAIVGLLYAEGDERRDGGFSLFYLGINLGAFGGPLLTGLAQDDLGFHYGFGLAAIGMALGLVQYTFGRRTLPDEANEISNPLPTRQRTRMIAAAVVIVVVITLAAVTGLLKADNLNRVVIVVTVVAAVIYFAVILTSKQITSVERRRVVAFIPMFLASAAFWSLYQQQFSVVTIYSDERLDRNLFGWEMPVSWVQSINPVFVIVLSGVFAAMWTRLGSRQPVTPLKFAAGTVVMGVAFLLFIPFSGSGKNGTPLLGLAAILLVFTIAELLLSPVGLSLSTKLAPENFRTQMVALFFLSVALGTAMAGYLAGYYSTSHERSYFGILGLTAIVLGVVLGLLTKPITALMGGVR